MVKRIDLQGSACKCNKCGQQEIFHRMGCKCWGDMGLWDDSYSMTYGHIVDGEFMPNSEIINKVNNGYSVFYNGDEIPRENFLHDL